MEDEIQLDAANEINEVSTEKHSSIVEIKEKHSSMRSVPKEKRSKERTITIFRVPATIRKNSNPNDYEPKKVSFGPFYQSHFPCMETEYIKRDVVFQSFIRFDKTIDDYIQCLNQYVQALENAYHGVELKEKEDSDMFLEQIIVDACFLLGILHEANIFYDANRSGRDYDWDSPVWDIDGISPKKLMECYRHDVLLLENQIPMLALEKLVVFQTNKSIKEAREYLQESILKFISPKVTKELVESASYDHVLDMYRHYLVFEEIKRSSCLEEFCSCFMIWFMSIFYFLPHKAIHGKHGTVRDNSFMGGSRIHYSIPSATDLDKVGIGFTISKTESLMDISFVGRNLSLPQISVDAVTKPMFLNIIALERCEVDVQKSKVTSYIYFMSNLIQRENDVTILQSRGIIHSRLPTDEIAGLFNSLTTEEIMPDPDAFLVSKYRDVAKSLAKSYYKMSNEWKRDLWQNYLKSPWAIVSLIAAFLLFSLTVIQTVYTVLGYYNS